MSDGSYCHCHCVIGICVSAAKFDSNRQSNYFLLMRRDVKLCKYGDQRPLTPSSIGLISALSFPSGGECGVQSAECTNQALIPSICCRTLHLSALRPSLPMSPWPLEFLLFATHMYEHKYSNYLENYLCTLH